MSTILYGLRQCDTVRKARRWLDERSIDHRFHDLRSDGVDEDTLRRWAATLGWRRILNQRSATWRQLPAERKTGLDEAGAITLMREYPALIKRPVLERDGTLVVGFDAALYGRTFEHAS